MDDAVRNADFDCPIWRRTTELAPETCFVCGSHNPAGLHARYTAQADDACLAHFIAQEHHQGYPGRMHGGIIAALLDETIGRAALARDATAAAGPRTLRVRYRQPAPLGIELVAIGRPMSADGAAELRLANGEVAAEAHVRYGASDVPQPTTAEWKGRPTGNKQPNSRMCFVCGTSNFAGLKARFYEQADGSVLARFTPTALHTDDAGGLNLAAIAAVMDEVMGRAIMIPYGEAIWGVTAELRFQIYRPAPPGIELTAVGRITGERSRIFEGCGELLLPDGTIAVAGYGRYVKLDMVTLGGFNPEHEEWGVRPD